MYTKSEAHVGYPKALLLVKAGVIRSLVGTKLFKRFKDLKRSKTLWVQEALHGVKEFKFYGDGVSVQQHISWRQSIKLNIEYIGNINWQDKVL